MVDSQQLLQLISYNTLMEKIEENSSLMDAIHMTADVYGWNDDLRQRLYTRWTIGSRLLNEWDRRIERYYGQDVGQMIKTAWQ